MVGICDLHVDVTLALGSERIDDGATLPGRNMLVLAAQKKRIGAFICWARSSKSPVIPPP